MSIVSSLTLFKQSSRFVVTQMMDKNQPRKGVGSAVVWIASGVAASQAMKLKNLDNKEAQLSVVSAVWTNQERSL